MKKIILSLTALIFISINVNSQTYQPFPTGSASWEVTRCWYFYDPGWYDKYTFMMDGTDTLYNGEVFKKIYVTNHHLPGTVHDTIYPTEFFGGLRESNRQIFIYQLWASVDTSVQMVYDFTNTNLGDTIYTNVLSGNPNLMGHLVTATDSVFIGTKFHKRLHLQDPYNSYNTEYWIEGVGSSWGLPFASFWSITDNSYDLSCFYENHELNYKNPSPVYGYCQAPQPMIDCEIISSISTEQDIKGSFFSMYPNPGFDEVTFDVENPDHKNMQLNVYDITGALVRSLILNQGQLKLNVEALNSGIYIVILKSDDLIESQRLVIQR
jgi:hypothetical protein